MTNNLDELLELLVYYADSIGSRRDHKAGKDMYTCPFCHSGEHGTGSTGAMHIGRGKDGTLLYYCHSCNSGGNIINMYCQHHGITQTRENFSQIIKGLKQDLGLSTGDYQGFKQSYKFRNPVQNEDLTPKTNVDQKDYTKFFNLSLQNQGRAIEYLRNVRKIEYAESIAQYFQIGYIPNYAYEWKDNQPSKTTSAIIIPTSQHSYAWRSTTENLKKKSGTVRPLNIEILGNNTKKFIFLVEGEFDLFSILDITNDIQNCEFSAISVNSAGNLPRFLDNQIKANIQKDTTLIIALDNDEKPNLNVEKFIKQGLNIAKKNKIPCIVADVKELYLNQKDSNEALKFNREEFKKSLINEFEKAKTLDITQYLADCDKVIDNSLDVSTYDWDDVGRIDRAYSFTQNCLRYCKQSNSWYQYDNHLGILRKNLTDRFIDELHRQIKDQLQKELELYKIKDKQNLESDNKTSYAKDFRAVFNKRLVGSAEMNANSGGEMNIFKSLTGSDALPLEMKNKGCFSYHFKGMLWFCCNHLPEVSSKHQEELYNRLIIFPCTNVVPKNQQDPRLKEKLFAERTGIIIKALKALKEAIKRDYKFTIPNECIKAKDEYMTENNPLALFMKECTTERPDKNAIQDNCTTKKLYDVFKAWCNTYGFFAMNIIQFRKLLTNYLNIDNIKDVIKRTAQNTYYTFTLNNRTKQDFVQVYGVDNILPERILA